MKKLLVGLVSLSVLVVGFIPAQAAGEYVARQKTLSDAIGSAIALNSKQKAEIKQVVDANPYAEKFICTGIRLEGQPLRMNIVVRKRAKAACDYAKQLNPALSTWFQNKPTKAPSYNGRVLLTLKIPKDLADAVPKGYVETEAIDWKINPGYKVGLPCAGKNTMPVVGLNKYNALTYLECPYQGGKFFLNTKTPKIDPVSKKPLYPSRVPEKTAMSFAAGTYIVPKIVTTQPRTSVTEGFFEDYPKCKIAEVEDGSLDKSFGFPLPEIRADLSSDFKILVVPVQFTDHQTTNRPADDMSDVIASLSNFYSRSSSTEVEFNWTIPETYYQMGRSIKSFDLGKELGRDADWWPPYKLYLEAVVGLVDEDIDFSLYDAVIIEEPRSVTDAEHGMYIPMAPYTEDTAEAIYSDDGEILSMLVTGNDQIRDIPNWIHEFGHLLGLPDGNKQVGSSQPFGIMWAPMGLEMTTWSRWQAGMISDRQVDCKTDTATSTHWLRPLAWTGDHQKGVVIPISDHEVIVVESRRRQGYDVNLGRESEGAYVYRIDTSAMMYQPDSKKIVDVIASPSSNPIIKRYAVDAPLKLGESVTSDGWTITVKETGAFGDVVEVRKN